MTRTRLFIDTISLTVPIDASLHRQVRGELDHLAAAGVVVAETNPFSKLLKGYQHAYMLRFHSKNFCYIQIYPRNRGRFLRLEWNPAKAISRVSRDPFGMIGSVLQECIPNYSADLFDRAHITRIDLTFDVLRTPIDSIFVSTRLRSAHSGQYVQCHEQFGTAGDINSRYLGRYSSDRYLLMYDRLAEAKSRQIGRNPARGTIRIPSDTTRFELSINPNLTIDRFIGMDNPYPRYLVVSRQNAESIRRDYDWRFFIAACALYGSQAALSMIPNRRIRTKYRDALQELDPPTWWNPDQLWHERLSAIGRAFGVERRISTRTPRVYSDQ